METLKLNMYVRTKKGLIAKIINIFDDKNVMSICGKIQTEKFGLDENEIIKVSYNIIDLIEVGDYVNGGQVREITNDYIRISGGDLLWEYLEEKEEIKTIVTKQQMESMQYEIK